MQDQLLAGPLPFDHVDHSSSNIETKTLLQPLIAITGLNRPGMDDLQTETSVLDGLRTSEEPPTLNPPDEAAARASAPSVSELSPEELVAKAIAPVKKEFLRPPPTRPSTISSRPSDDVSEAKSTAVLKDKKSKRQLKRERRQELKSALHLCPVVAKSGKVSSCIYGEKCRFSHDLEAFKSEKPDDLDGNCPFTDVTDGPCPYGLACRFSGTHKDVDIDAAGAGTVNSLGKSSEINYLKKDVQKLLWKNKMKFHKADATLKLLGLDGKIKKSVGDEENNQLVADGSTSVEGNGNQLQSSTQEVEDHKADDADVVDELRPSKKVKSAVDGTSCSTGIDNCTSNTESDLAESHGENGSALVTDESKYSVDSDKSIKLHPREKKIIDFRDKLYLAPLTTVGNLPFRRVCKGLGADVTCGEMAMCTNLLQGQASEWALLRRHSSEDLFGVQVCGAYPDTVARTVELIERECSVDFIDINMGCPIDIVVNKGAGSALLTKPMRMKGVIEAASRSVDTPLTMKVRTAYFEGRNRIDSLIENFGNWGASAITIHGRSRQQRYSKLADWEYIYQCTQKAPDSLQVLGNGDIFSYLDWNKHKSDSPKLSACMFARGALVKPWIFTEVREQRHWDISSGERLDILKDYVRFGLQHWGSDSKGVETTRHFLLEWLSYTYRYVPVGLLEVVPQRINWRPPSYYGRDDLETLMASDSAADWVRISELLLGKVPAGFTFSPKHKSNAYDRAENG